MNQSVADANRDKRPISVFAGQKATRSKNCPLRRKLDCGLPELCTQGQKLLDHEGLGGEPSLERL
eukprot:2956828-Alexandrium_andersonii.AAC.1